jgi:hypothetical protein
MAKRKRTAAQIEEDNKRTTSRSFFVGAEAYQDAAKALWSRSKSRKNARRPLFGEHPIRFCFYHSIELYLKAFLRMYHQVHELSDKFGHNVKNLMKSAQEFGYEFDDEDVEVLNLVGEADAMIRARYFTAPGRARTCG